MNLKRFIAGCIVIAACTSVARSSDNDTLTGVRLEGSVYVEANYGHRFSGAERNRWDFPHTVVAAAADFGRGWTVEAELEYERMYEDGEWCNDHWDNFAVNRLFVAKTWTPAVGLRLGVVGVQLGITNSGGPALTIYDPVSEAALMPMTWHEAGGAFFGQAGRWTYEVAALLYGAAPLRDSRAIGVAAALHYSPMEGMRVGAGMFRGRADRGNIHSCSPDFIDGRRLTYAVAEAELEKGGWTASASMIYTDADDARSVGVEAGYDVMTGLETGLGLTPYVRYDGVFGVEEEAICKWTAGVGMELPAGFSLKAEYGRCRHRGAFTEHTLDVSVGYELKF